MFSKKILGLVGLLFIGTQVKAELNACSEDSVSPVVDGCVGSSSYCIVGNKIYEYGTKEAAPCKVKVTDEVLFFNESGVKVELSDINITEPGAELKMYYCDSNSCVETEGYVHNNQGSFLIKDDKAISKDANGSCDENVGKLAFQNVNEIHLCLAGGKTVRLDDDDSEGSYLVSSLGDLELNGEAKKKYVITKIKNEEILLLNKLYTTGCYIESDESIMHTIDHFCEEGVCDYYACTEGECTSESGVCTRNITPPPTCDPTETESENNCIKPGYYLGADNKLYSCEGNNAECVDQSTTDNGTTTHPTGYYVDASSDNNKYIECNGGATCRAITVDLGECNKNGLVYLYGGKINLCLDKEGIVDGSKSQISIILNGDDAVQGNYFIKASDSGNIFGSGNNYTIVTVNGGNVVKYSFNFNAESEDNKLFRYAGDNYEVLTKQTQGSPEITTRSQSVCESVNDLYEFGSICSDGKGTGNYEFKDYRNRRQ